MKKAKFILPCLLAAAILLVCVFMLPALADAATDVYTDGNYTYIVSDGEVTIEYFDDIPGDVTIPDTLGGYPVTSIGNSAFADNVSLTSITIPDSVTSIGSDAFYYCTSLTSVTIPDSVTSIGEGAFSDCRSLTSITIPDGVTSIGNDAFSRCSSLTEITIPDGVTSIGDYAFGECTSLTNVTIPDSVTSIGDYAFAYCNSLSDIYIANASAWCMLDLYSIFEESSWEQVHILDEFGQEVAQVVLDDSVTSIPSGAFNGCTSLTSITIPDSVTNIDSSAFDGCTNLTGIWVDEDNPNYTSDDYGVLFNKNMTELIQFPCGFSGSYTIPDIVTSIGYLAIYNCTNLTSLTIPDNLIVTDFSQYGCTNLTGIWVNETNPNYSNDEYGFLFNKEQTTLILAPSGYSGDYTIPSTVTAIKASAFYYCTNLTGITIPDSMTSIGGSAFRNCTGLTNITIPTSVTSIGEGAFYNCSNLTEVYYPGTEDQWNAISIDTYDENLTNATVHYNHAHDYSLFPATTVEYCDEIGYIEYTCIYGETCRIPTPAIGHVTGTDAAVIDPTCTEQGYVLSTCARCGEKGKSDFVTALGHDYTGEVVEQLAPTCTQQGYVVYKCIRCDAHSSKQISNSLGHSVTIMQAVSPTCGKTGLTAGSYCQRCQTVFVQQTVVAALGHTFEEGICTTCGGKEGYCHHCGKNTAWFTWDGSTISGHYYSTETISEVTLSGEDVVLDLRGHNVTGDVTATDGTLLCMDSETDDYTVDDGVYGKLTGTVTGDVQAAGGYLMVTNEDGVSFHKVDTAISSISFRPTKAGIYYGGTFMGDEVVAENIKTFGVALSITELPTADEDGFASHCQYSAFTAEDFAAGNTAEYTSTVLTHILSENYGTITNRRNGTTQVYGRSYIQFTDGTYLFSSGCAYSLQDVVECTDSIWSTLGQAQKAAVLELYANFPAVFNTWEIPNIKEAANG